jgi:glycogen debranching enzyme
MAARTRAGFARFWCAERGHCFDVLDGPDGAADPRLRPNQLLALSLPDRLLPPHQERSILRHCARHLLTSHGLRSLDPRDGRYRGRYGGDRAQRDEAYHQGTVWAWWLGSFALAHGRLQRDPQGALSFLEPFAHHLRAAGLGSISEIFDGDPPHAPRGCIAQAWSVAEVLRAWTEAQTWRHTASSRPWIST